MWQCSEDVYFALSRSLRKFSESACEKAFVLDISEYKTFSQFNLFAKRLLLIIILVTYMTHIQCYRLIHYVVAFSLK